MNILAVFLARNVKPETEGSISNHSEGFFVVPLTVLASSTE